MNPGIDIVARASGQDYLEVLKDAGVSEIVLPEFEASLEMTRQSLLRLRIPATEIQRQTDTVRHELYAKTLRETSDYRVLSQLRNAEQQFDLQWVRLSPESPMVNRSIRESEIRKKTGTSIVGVVREGGLVPNPDADFVLLPDDLVAIIGGEENRESFCLLGAFSRCSGRS
jgi:CPA2 family monovalent cation:H+ antiporter-2